MNIPLSAFAPENLVSRDGFGSPVPRQPAHLHTQTEYGAYLRDSSRVPRRRPFIYTSRYKTAICDRATRSCWGGNIGTRIASTTSIQLLTQIRILSVENDQANPGRPAEFVSGDQILGREQGQGEK